MNFGVSLRIWLVAPAIVALVTWMVARALPPRSPHLMELIVIDFACGFVELVAAIVAISRLIRVPAARSFANVTCTAIGTIPALLFVGWYWRSLY